MLARGTSCLRMLSWYAIRVDDATKKHITLFDKDQKGRGVLFFIFYFFNVTVTSEIWTEPDDSSLLPFLLSWAQSEDSHK